MLSYYPFDLADPGHHLTAAELWTRACGDTLALSARAIEYNTRPSIGAQQMGQFAQVDGAPVGFVLASVLGKGAEGQGAPDGWVDALAVAREWRRRGIGQALLEWAEEWLRAQGCAHARLGASLRWFAPGLPIELDDSFFRTRGFVPRADASEEWDLGQDLSDYQSPTLRKVEANIRPATKSDIRALRTFLAREFPGRWHYEFEQHLNDGGDVAENILLESERGVDACCRVTFEDSVRRAERYYPTPLPHPWGQVGTIGVSGDSQNEGFGSALLDGALKHLKVRGVRGCIVDWTDLIAYYERFGFRKHRAYRMLSKELYRK